MSERETIARALVDVTNRWIKPNFPEGHKLRGFDELDEQEQRLNLDYADAALGVMQAASSAQCGDASLHAAAKRAVEWFESDNFVPIGYSRRDANIGPVTQKVFDDLRSAIRSPAGCCNPSSGGGGNAVDVPAQMQGSNDRGSAQDAERPEDTMQGDRPVRPVTCPSPDFVNGLKSLSGLRRLSPEMSDFIFDAAEEMERLSAQVEDAHRLLREARRFIEADPTALPRYPLLNQIRAALTSAALKTEEPK